MLFVGGVTLDSCQLAQIVIGEGNGVAVAVGLLIQQAVSGEILVGDQGTISNRDGQCLADEKLELAWRGVQPSRSILSENLKMQYTRAYSVNHQKTLLKRFCPHPLGTDQ